MSRNTQTLLYLGPIVNCQPLWLHKFHWLHSAAVTASSCVSLDYHCDCYRTPHQCRCTCTYAYHRTQAPQLTRPLRCQLLSLCFPICRLDFRYRIRGYRNSWNYLYNMENILQYAKKLSYGKLSVCPLMVVTLSSSLAVVAALCHSAAALPAQQVLAFLRCHCITANIWVTGSPRRSVWFCYILAPASSQMTLLSWKSTDVDSYLYLSHNICISTIHPSVSCFLSWLEKAQLR